MKRRLGARTRPRTLRVTLTEQQLEQLDSIIALPSFDVRGDTPDERRADALVRLPETERRRVEATIEQKADRNRLETERHRLETERDELQRRFDEATREVRAERDQLHEAQGRLVETTDKLEAQSRGIHDERLQHELAAERAEHAAGRIQRGNAIHKSKRQKKDIKELRDLLAYALEALSIARDTFPTSGPGRVMRTMFAAEDDIYKALVQDPTAARIAEKSRKRYGDRSIFDVLEHYRQKSSRTTDFVDWEPPD